MNDLGCESKDLADVSVGLSWYYRVTGSIAPPPRGLQCDALSVVWEYSVPPVLRTGTPHVAQKNSGQRTTRTARHSVNCNEFQISETSPPDRH